MVGCIRNLIIMELLLCLEKDHCRFLFFSLQGLMHNKKATELSISDLKGGKWKCHISFKVSFKPELIKNRFFFKLNDVLRIGTDPEGSLSYKQT